MQITGVTQHHLSADIGEPYEPTWIPGYPQSTHEVELFAIETDAGITGITASPSFAGGLDYETPLSLFLLGEDPHDIGKLRRKLDSIRLIGPRVAHIEIALWDIIGKDAGKPIYELLGGTGDSVRAYASTAERQDPEDRLAYVERRVEEGFQAVKLRFGPDPTTDLAVARRVRERYPDLTLMVDGNMGWSVRVMEDRSAWSFDRALRVARELAALGNVAWLEEPLHRTNYEGLSRLRSRTDVPIAGGEFNEGVHELRDLIDRGCLDVLQPDATLVTGIEGATEVAAMARAHGLTFAPHTWTNGVGLAANLHVMAAVETDWCEFPLEPPWTPGIRDFLLESPIEAEDGQVTPPPGPGLGIEIDWDQVEANDGRRLSG